MSNKTKIKKNKVRKEKLRQMKYQDRLKNQKHKPKRGKLSKRPKLTQGMFPDEQFRFWLAHGVNYIVSDYENGIWEPMFPSIYENTAVDSAVIAKTITTKFTPLTDKEKHWPKAGKTAMSWSLMTREVVYIYYREVIQRLKASLKGKDVETTVEELATSPGNPIVWGVFKYMLDGVK